MGKINLAVGDQGKLRAPEMGRLSDAENSYCLRKKKKKERKINLTVWKAPGRLHPHTKSRRKTGPSAAVLSAKTSFQNDGNLLLTRRKKYGLNL